MEFPESRIDAPGVDPPPLKRVSRTRWWIHLLVLGAYPVVVGILGSGKAAPGQPALSHTARGLLLVCGAELLVFGIVFAVAWISSRASRTDLLWRWRGGLWPIPLAVGYSVLLRLAVGLISVLVFTILAVARVVSVQQIQDFARTNAPDVSALVDVAALKSDPVYFWLTVTLVSFVVAGLREEVWRSGFLAGLRWLWPQRFGSLGGQIAAVAVAACVFGAGHLALGPLGVAAATLLGFGLGVIMVRHRSIWPAVLAHGAFDATTFAILPKVLDQLRHAS